MTLTPTHTDAPPDLSACDREPIHTPGCVQPHGVLLALREPDLSVFTVSANADEVLGVAPDQLLGSGLERFVDPARLDWCRDWLRSADVRESGPVRLDVGPAGRARAFDAAAHRHDGALVLELEPADAGPPAPDHTHAVRRVMARLQAAGTLRDFCRVAVAEVRALTGFDRVTAYRFAPDWNGEVVAEDFRPDLPPWMGLHFPASDIPEPARRLYHLNTVRFIADVHAQPAPLLPAADPLTGRPLDLGLSALRGVSPVHIQYLKNMGVRTSMSMSLMRDGRLWGLITCMHYAGVRRVTPEARAACDFLARLASAQLAVKEDAEGHEYRDQLRAVRERLLQRMAQHPDPVGGLVCPDLLELTGAAGAAVAFGGSCALVGRTPNQEQTKRLVAWLRVHAEGDVFHTDSLAAVYPEAAEFTEVASGLVAVTTAKAQGHYVLWFRPEVVQTVDWGGDPGKNGDAGPAGELTPRRSFERWKEVVRLHSLPWLRWELEAARLLRDAVIAVVVRRAEELTRLNAELERSNSDLDAFAFITSHDLKEPLRGIHNYASFVIEDYAEKLDAEGVSKLQTLVRLSQRMEDLVESLLRYSRLGRGELAVEPVDLDAVLRGVLDLLRVTLEGERVEVRVPRPLPVVRCDRVQVDLLFNNLITNAVKYNDKPAKWVEVGYAGPESNRAFYVRDNGIGVPEKHSLAIFRMFKRLHGRDKFGGGTGAGLAFVKKIVERHGGGVWVESVSGEGSTFFFTLGAS